ncbi:hypothetical protein J40TS1_37040 [Paenibacillus montaniterrae]|uniref:DUF4309 domain-containing protein n=1 Tax=Paenibacillus montaniterrae TaxID=429341 RepID=A0A919YP60_9BACL|nr:hypothetical protein [Paenibacillus montaniterrae]GIP18062.1 hypothetical protein J40TS1_37040 [Paenibacillus montaniterrae]
MKVAKLFACAILIMSLLAGCAKSTQPEKENAGQEEQTGTNTNEPSNPQVPESTAPQELSDFAVRIGNSSIALKDKENEVNLEELLGAPSSEETTVLGETADTLAGTHVKTQQYDGLELQLFSPKQDQEQFWIQSITITNESYSTSKEVTINDSLEQLIAAYPTIEMAKDGRTDPNNCAYVIAESVQFLTFEVDDGVIKEIKLYYELQ